MYLFGLEGSGFIISLGLTLLISGAIMFYVLKRFQMVENSLIENAKILQTFINRSQEQQINNNLANSNIGGDIASDIAINSAIEQQNNINNRIEVSDDESDFGDENKEHGEGSDDSEDSEDSEVSDLSCDDKIKDINIINNYQSNSDSEENEGLKIHDINNELTTEFVESVKIIALNDFEELKNDKLLEVNSLSELNNNVNEENEENEENQENEENEENEENNLEIKEIITEKEEKDEKDEKLKNYSKLKMSELKELVVVKKLIDSKTDINKLKKIDLIKLLQNN
tara:strand:+ start:4223 stop:5077 length:855 start_codon:yes stop_codon:yes gene_type:complete